MRISTTPCLRAAVARLERRRRRRLRRRGLVWRPGGHCLRTLFAVLLVLATPALALAHERPPQRALTLQIDGQGLAALWQVELGGPEAALLRGMHDSDRDGALDESERGRLAGVVLARMLTDVNVSTDGEPVRYQKLDAVLTDITPSGILKVVGLGALAPTPSRDCTLRVAPTRGPLEVVVQALDDWQTDISRAAKVLAAGKAMEVMLHKRELR